MTVDCCILGELFICFEGKVTLEAETNPLDYGLKFPGVYDSCFIRFAEWTDHFVIL